MEAETVAVATEVAGRVVAVMEAETVAVATEVAARVVAVMEAETVAVAPTSTINRWCKSCSGWGADTGSCLLCLCCKIRTV